MPTTHVGSSCSWSDSTYSRIAWNGISQKYVHMFCPQELPYCIHLLCFWIGLQWYRDPRGPRLYSGLGDCPNNPILSLPSPQKMPTPVYTDTEAALFTEVPRRQILRNSLASGSAAALCPLSWND